MYSRLLLVLTVFISGHAAVLRAAQPPDPVLLDGLQAALPNGVEATLRVWYADRLPLAVEIRDRLLPITSKLGEIVDTEIVATQAVSKRVTRYYLAIYFTQGPLWLRVERYSNGEKTFFLPLRFSINPDEILPGYVTEFYPHP